MKISKNILLLLLVPLSFYFLSCNSGGSKNLTITGAFALYPLTVKWIEAYKKANPETGFDLSAGGAGKGLTDVLAGASDFGMFSREITDAELSKGIWYVAVAKDAVLPTVSRQNSILDLIHRKGLTRQQLIRIFTTGRPVTWGQVLDTADDRKINVYTRSDAAGAAATWAGYLGKKGQEDLKGVGIYGDPGLADAVAKDPQGIGFNNTAFVYNIKTGEKNSNVDVIPLDLNGNRKIDSEESFYGNIDAVMKAISAGIYPSPPARDLYFISKGKPTDPRVIAFLKWALTEGQSYVKATGYVPLSPEQIQTQLDKLQ